MSSILIDQYTDEFSTIVNTSYSFAEIVKKLGYSSHNGRNSDVVKKKNRTTRTINKTF